MSGVNGAWPRVYVLIVNWKGWRDTVECLQSVFRLDYPHHRVVVLDNHSENGSVEEIRAWAARQSEPIPCAEYSAEEAAHGGGADAPLTLVRLDRNLGFAGANNAGIRYAQARGDGDFLWLLNNDTVTAPEALGALVKLMQADPAVGMAGSRLLYYDRPQTVQAIGGGRLIRWQGRAPHLGAGEPDRGQWNAPLDLDCVLGASLLVRSEVAEAIGPMDEEYFMYSEELDWCWSARRTGWRLAYAPGSVVWHKVGRSAGQKSPNQDYYAVRNTLRFVRKHFPRLLPAAVVYSVYRSFLPKVVRRQPQRALAVLSGYRDFFRRRFGSR